MNHGKARADNLKAVGIAKEENSNKRQSVY